MMRGEINRQRERLNNCIRKLISSLREFSLLDIWYPCLSESVVQLFLVSPIFTRTKGIVYDSPSSLPFSTNVTSTINKLLKDIHLFIPLIIKCVDEYLSQNRPTPTYIPCSSSIQFFASSTFPSLFGYCWCIEQGSAYVDAICMLLSYQMKRYRSVTSSNFRNSFVREIIRQFIHITGVQRYLQRSISDHYMDLIYDDSLDQYPIGSKDYNEILVGYISIFSRSLIDNIQYCPSLLRYFFMKAYLTAESVFGVNSLEANQLIEIFMYDYILQPALLNPKLYSLIPETSAVPFSMHMISFARIFRWASSSYSVPDHFEDDSVLSYESFRALPIKQLMVLARTFDGNLEGVFSMNLQNTSQMRFHLLLLSINDMVFLSEIIATSIEFVDDDPKDKQRLKSLILNDRSFIENDSTINEFWFQSFKLPNQPFLPETPSGKPQLLIPLLQEKSVPIKKDELTSVINHLFSYLEALNPQDDYPQSLIDFLEYQKEIAIRDSLTEELTKAQAVIAKLHHYNPSETELYQRMQNTILSRLENHSKDIALSFEHEEICSAIEGMHSKIYQLNEQLSSIIHQSLMRLFFIREKSICSMITDNPQLLFSSQDAWIERFISGSVKLYKFSLEKGLDDSHKTRLIRQLHSYILSNSYSLFLSFNKQLSQRDLDIDKAYPQLYSSFMRETIHPGLASMISSKSCFEYAASLIKRGSSKGSPLDRMFYINKSICLLRDVFSFESEEPCSDDQLISVVYYCLVFYRIPKVLSCYEFLKYFLFSVDPKIDILSSEEKRSSSIFSSCVRRLISKSHPK